jgi:hypothetical protein
MMQLRYQFAGWQTIGDQDRFEKERRVQYMDKGIKSKVLVKDKLAYIEAEAKS